MPLAHLGGEAIEVYEFPAVNLVLGLVDRFDVVVRELEFLAREHHLLYGSLDGGLRGGEVPRLDLVGDESFKLGSGELYLHDLRIASPHAESTRFLNGWAVTPPG